MLSEYFIYHVKIIFIILTLKHVLVLSDGNEIRTIYEFTLVETICYSEDGNYEILLFSNEHDAMEYSRLSI